MIAKKHIYGRRPLPPNTFIGGVGGSLSTKNLLATKLGIAPTRIKSFRIVNDEVQAHIQDSYTIRNGCFYATTITHYIDSDGLVLGIENGAFANTPIIRAEFKNALTFSANFNDVVEKRGVFNNCVMLKHINLKSLQNLGNADVVAYHFRNVYPDLILMDNIKTPTAYGLGFSNFTFSLLNLESTRNHMFENCKPQNFETFKNLEFNIGAFRASKFYEIKLNNVTSISTKTGIFQGMTITTLIELKKLKTFGDPASIGGTIDFNYAFGSLKTGCRIRVNIALATTNSGIPDASLSWAKANRNAIVEFYDDNGNYISTL